MERIVEVPKGTVALPAKIWSFILDHALARSQGTPGPQTSFTTSLQGTEYTVGLNDDHSKVIVLKSGNVQAVDAARLRLRMNEEESGETSIHAQSQWDEDDPDAEVKSKRRTVARERQAILRLGSKDAEAVIEANASRRIEIDLDDIDGVVGKPLVVGTDLGRPLGEKQETADDRAADAQKTADLEQARDERDLARNELVGIAKIAGVTAVASIHTEVANLRAEAEEYRTIDQSIRNILNLSADEDLLVAINSKLIVTKDAVRESVPVEDPEDVADHAEDLPPVEPVVVLNPESPESTPTVDPVVAEPVVTTTPSTPSLKDALKNKAKNK